MKSTATEVYLIAIDKVLRSWIDDKTNYCKDFAQNLERRYFDIKVTNVSLSSIPKGEKALAYLYWNKDAYSIHCRNYIESWDWVEKRNENRYQSNLNHGKNYY